jgi:glutamate 5-kinase
MNRDSCLKRITGSKRIVLKVGTSLLTDPQSEDGINHAVIAMLRDEILFLRGLGIEVVLVSSGAQGMGRQVLRRLKRNGPASDTLARKQALAAIGQGKLMSVYAEAFAPAGLFVAQILITARDFHDRRTYLNIGHTMQEILAMGGLAVVNENDTVLADEIQFGDNDVLSAACASLLHADALLILTSVEGFLVDGVRVPFLSDVTKSEMSLAGGPSGPGTGGMFTKLRAGQFCLMSGASFAILPGRIQNPVQSLFRGNDVGTMICGENGVRMGARKRWILYSRSRGSVVVDDGAKRALVERGSSLLPAGIIRVEGRFFPGDVIEIEDRSGLSIGRGITNYGQREVLVIMGRKSSEFEKEGRHDQAHEVIHRNNMILEREAAL